MGMFGNIKNQVVKENQLAKKRKAELKKINSRCICNNGTIKELNKLISDKEEILYFVGGTYERQYYNIFATNKRIILISKAGFKTAQLQIPIEKISSIRVIKGIIVGKIKIWDGSIAGVEVEKIPNKDADTFVNIVNEQMNNYKSFKIEVNQTVERDITDKIEKLAELKKEGLLTEYEFAIKKMELLEKVKK